MSDRIRTVDMSDPSVVLDCYKKLNVAYKELKAENERLRAALKPFADIAKQTEHWSGPPASVPLYVIRAAADALKENKE